MKKFYLFMMLVLGGFFLHAQTVTITDNGGAGTGTTTWTSDNTYVLDGFVYVNAGDTLTIEAGTVIKGNPGDGADASALIVARGGYIHAEGTADNPIIFTGLADDVNNPFDVAPNTTGLWGGVILLGNASTNTVPGEQAIEGIPAGETRALYGELDGATNDEDNSGVFRYVSIRHGGSDIGAGNEINGLTMGGVGSGTTIDHVEVIYNADDGFEWFGGTVDCKYLVAAFCGDDAMDYDQGWRGKGQFWFVLQSDDSDSDRGGEHDGGTSPETGMPFATPQIYNATYIGRGEAANKRALTFRDNAGGMYINSIFMGYGNGVDIELLASGTHSFDRVKSGELALYKNIFWNTAGNNIADVFTISAGDGVMAADEAAANDTLDARFNGMNAVVDPQLIGVARTAGTNELSPRPLVGGPAFDDLADYPENDDCIRQVSYKGAFSASQDLWTAGWTYLDEQDYFTSPEPGTVTVSDNTGAGTTTWTNNNTYFLDGFVFVNPGDTLIIEAGTVIKGLPGAGADASALIVSRGAYIIANGTAADPIIFTGAADDVTNAFDIPPHTQGLWGGVIILGSASTNTVPGEQAIEGIPAGEPRALYGGTNNDDNSGFFRYVSIRHGGSDIGAGNEINGLTMGGVGSGTTIDHIEVIYNADDGFEWFGGTVNCSNLIAAFCGDDAMDYDQGWRGKGQFWFVLQSDAAGSDRGGEHDGGTSPETGEPFATPNIYNATYIGRGAGSGKRALTFRDNAGGTYANSIFMDYDRGVDVELLASGTHSYDRLVAGDLQLRNNIFWNVAGNTPADVFTISAGSGADGTAATAAIQAYFADSANTVSDPELRGVSRDPDGGLNPTPRNLLSSPAFTDLANYPFDGYIRQVSYKGAFSSAQEHWALGWTYLDEQGYFGTPPAGEVTVSDNTGSGTTTWTSNNTYFLDGFVFVNPGDTLIIEAGTVIKGLPGAGADASALIVSRGAYIIANGTEADPIIFTGAADDVSNAFDIPPHTTGLWGGVIILGSAGTNTVPGEQAIEGIPAGEPRGLYGGENDDDNSGIFRYVSIRHGGSDIGAGNEINGLTMGGVGSGTTIDHIEVIYNADDGFEWFGGTVNCSHLIAAFCGDDAMDYDQGWRGKGQFWVVLQSDAADSDRGGEHDGGTSPETGTPFATPQIYNATYIGRGEAAGKRALTFRDNAGGRYANSIFTEYGRGVDVELLASGTHSADRLVAGDLNLDNNIFWNVAGNDAASIFTISAGSGVDAAIEAASTAAIQQYFGDANNVAVDPELGSISRDPDGGLNPVPNISGPAFRSLAEYPEADDFIQQVSYKGAFSASPSHWAFNWTYLDEQGYFAPVPSGTVTVTDNTGEGTTLWTKNNTYLLDGFVFVNPGDTLIIEAGTVIKGLPGAGADASALIVSRNAYIDAQGTAAEPIIFTGAADDVTDATDIPPHTTGLWGGVIILGSSSTNTVPGEQAIEGIPAGEPRALYGGDDVEDNSGIFTYVSIRHGGSDIGAGNEINGLTMGGVGSKTIIHHVEVIFNADDGFEWFGGTVNTKYLIAAFCGDDAMDYDQGWRGMNQYWFVLQSDEADSDRGGEHDGGTSPETGEPFATPHIYNATYIGRGEDAGKRALTLRDNAGGTYKNSIFTDYGRGVDIELLASGTHSYDRLEGGDLNLENNLFWNVAGNDAASVFTISAGSGVDATAEASATSFVQAYFGDNNNAVADPAFASLTENSRTAFSNELDPRALLAGAAYTDLADYPTGDFFTEEGFKGAFGNGADFWPEGWTYLDFLGYFPETFVGIEDKFEKVAGFTVYPNPNNGIFNLRAEDLDVNEVELSVIDLAGRTVYNNTVKPVAGELETSIDISALPTSVYILSIKQGNKFSTVRVVKR